MGPFGLTASFETPRYARLLRMRAEVVYSIVKQPEPTLRHPYSLSRPRGGLSSFAPRPMRGNGAPCGATSGPTPRGVDVPLQGTFATRRSTCGFSVRRDRASGRGHRIQAAFAALHPRRVQPLKAAPRSWSGRRPGASRRRGCETTPAGAASGSTIKTPLDDALTLSRTHRIIVVLGLKSIPQSASW